MRHFFERVLTLLRLRHPERDLGREIDAHLAMLQETYEARGLAPDAARRAARLAFGSIHHLKDQHRAARSFRWIEDAWQDAGHGIRLLRRSPVFTTTAALSLAIGIGANTAIFTVANALLFRPPAGITDPSQLVVIGTARGDGGLNPVGYPVYREIAHRTTSLTAVYAEQLFPHVMGVLPPGTALAEPVFGQSVTANFFSVLGSLPSRGRAFAGGNEAEAVLDFDYWKRRFNASDGIVGQVFRINGRPVTVVGVAAPGFHGTGIQQCDLWLAFKPDATTVGSVVAGGRLRPDVSFDAAAAELTTIGQAIDRDQGVSDNQPRRLSALPFSRASGNRKIVVGFSVVLMVLVSLVLGVACANVAGIMLTRATARGRELALRAALGAGRGRLVRQLFTETLLLFLLGGLVGVALARVLTRAAALLLPSLPTPMILPLTIDWRVLLFALSLSLSAAVAFGVLPAFKGANVDAGPWLKDGAHSSSARSRLRRAFVVGQVACSVLLVVLAASFVRVLRFAGAADSGFDPRGVDVATLDLSVTGEPQVETVRIWRRMIERVRQVPVVQAASLARVPPGGFEGIGLGGIAPGDRPVPDVMFSPAWNIVDTGYFATLHIPLVAGRDFGPDDALGGPAVVILSETLARRFWPSQPAVGKTVRLGVFNDRTRRNEQRLSTVIGVASDIRSSSLIDGLAEPYVYLPLAQSDALVGPGMTVQMSIVTRRRAEANLAPTIVAIVHDIDPRLVVPHTESLAQSVALGLTPQRVLATIGGATGLVALLLASMGIYGVTAYSVALRRREFAIRLALGAPRARVLTMIFSEGTGLVIVGLAIGLGLGVGAGQVLSVFLYGLPAAHIPTIVGTVLLFIVTGTTASAVPAMQAVREGWRQALREE